MTAPASARAIEELARGAFGLDVEAVEMLPGDLEANARITVRGTPDAPLLLRVYTSGLDPRSVAFQRDLVQHALDVDPGLGPLLQTPARPGQDPVRALFEGTEREARLLRFIPGRLFSELRRRPPALLEEFGEILGRLDRALLGFEGRPAPDPDNPWPLLDAPAAIEARLGAVDPSAARRGRLEGILAGCEARVAPVLGDLRRSVVHHDANENNVIVTMDPLAPRVAGIIDFGDAAHSATVTEVAIAAAYAGLGTRDPLGAMARVVAGYHRALPLEDVEFDVLTDLALLRLAQSVAISSAREAEARARGEAPDAYHLISQAPAWAALDALADVHPRLARAVLRDAAGLDPRPATRVFETWARRTRFEPLLGASLEDAPRVDLSVASPLLVEGAEDLSMEAWGRRLEELRRSAAAPATVGYHDESRLLYAASEAFGEPREDGVEPRTAHLGVDLFAPAGTEVRAPLDGRVLSVAVNAAPLDYGPTVILEHAPEDAEPFWTLYGHLEAASVAGLSPGDAIPAGAVVARLGAEEENGGWPPHLHFQVILDRLELEGDFPGVATPDRRAAWTALCPDPAPLLGLESCAAPGHSTDELLAARRAGSCSSMSISYRRPLQMVKGRGATLFDHEGRAYLDAVNNVPHVGHCHPRVVAAGQRQMALLNTNTRYLSEGIERYTELLRARLPAHLEVIYLVSSGSEANEVALRLARAVTGGAEDVLVQEHGYHGHTNATVARSHYKFARAGGFPCPPDVHVIACPDAFRGPHRGPDAGARYVEEVERTLARLEAAGRRPAAMLAEAIIGCGGQVVPPEGYLAGAFDAVRRAGGVAIADEVQVGFGRVGSHMWAFEEQGARPDIVTMGKPIGNGHPMAAVATTREIADAFAGGMEFFATFGGNNVSVAIGAEVLRVVDDERLMENAAARGAQFFKEMKPLAARHPAIGDVRGRGLYLGVDLVTDRETRDPWTALAAHVAERMRDHRVLVSTDGPAANVLKIKPPLVISADEITRVVTTLDRVLEELG